MDSKPLTFDMKWARLLAHYKPFIFLPKPLQGWHCSAQKVRLRVPGTGSSFDSYSFAGPMNGQCTCCFCNAHKLLSRQGQG